MKKFILRPFHIPAAIPAPAPAAQSFQVNGGGFVCA